MDKTQDISDHSNKLVPRRNHAKKIVKSREKVAIRTERGVSLTPYDVFTCEVFSRLMISSIINHSGPDHQSE